MTPESVQSLAEVEAIYRSGGWLAVAAALAHLFVRSYRSGAIDAFILRACPGLGWWERSRYWRLGAVVVASLAAAALTGLTAGQSWWVALLGGLPAALAAIGAHEVGETVGKAQRDRVEDELARARNLSLTPRSGPPSGGGPWQP